jgi:anti-sigma regulatory factor (Ser/Thr protein kinase)
MGAVNPPPGCRPTVDDVAWIRVEESSAVGAARRMASALAQRLGFSETRAAEIGLAVTELGTNLHKHATQGILLLRAARIGAEALVEIVATDRGPGMGDMTRALRDGHSTTGTLGIGLGAVLRLADWSRMVSRAGTGTVLAARFHPFREKVESPFAVGITRPFSTEAVCGDSYAIRYDADRVSLMLCDGAGHGPLAATASQRAVRVFCDSDPMPPAQAVERIHQELAHSRGGAVAVAELDPATATVRYAGIGNISGSVLDGERKRGMVCLPGIAGHRARTIRAFDYPFPPGSLVVMHSDGLTERWNLDDTDGVLTNDPLVIGSVLMRDAGVRQDDACVIVGRLPDL